MIYDASTLSLPLRLEADLCIVGSGPGGAMVAREAVASGLRVIVLETFSNRRVADKLAADAGARSVLLAQEVRALPEATSYEALFEYNVSVLAEVLAHQEAAP